MSKEWIGLTTPEGRGVWVRASEVEAVVDTKDAREVWTAAGAYDVREPIGDVLAALGLDTLAGVYLIASGFCAAVVALLMARNAIGVVAAWWRA